MALNRSIGARPDATRGTTALEVRRGFEGIFSSTGVVEGSASPLVQGTASFEYQLNGPAWFVTKRATGDGVHLFANDGAITVATGVAPGAGLKRIDVLWVRHRSADENGDTTSEPEFGVTQGTAASTPTAPALPAGALEVGRNTIESTATSTSSAGNAITQTADTATLRGVGLAKVRAYRTTTTSIPANVWTALSSWTQAVERTGPTGDLTVASGSVTANFTGWARVRVTVGWATGAGARFVRIMRNGARVASGGTSDTSTVIPAVAEYTGPVSSGDVFTVEVNQSTAGSLSTYVADQSTSLTVERTA